jgi:hypothetical protein
MAYYKVPQDVEAEDKLIGPFTFKQFVFLIIFFISGFVGFRLLQVNVALTGLVLPVFVISGILGFYRPADQPVETKLLAYINFYFKPRIRLWSRDGLLEHVLIQAPKRIEHTLRVRSREEVQSQLKQLSQIIDTRGWVVKQSAVQMPMAPSSISSDDRLITPSQVQVAQEPVGVSDSDDVMDGASNPLGRSFTQMAAVAEEHAREDAIQRMETAANTPQTTRPIQPAVATPTISSVRAFGSSSQPSDSASPTLTPHYQPYPSQIHQKWLDPSSSTPAPALTPEQHEEVVALATEMQDQPVSAVAAQAEHITHPDGRGIEFQIQHTPKAGSE